MNFLWQGKDGQNFNVWIFGEILGPSTGNYPLIGFAMSANGREMHFSRFNKNGVIEGGTRSYDLVDFPDNWDEYVAKQNPGLNKAIDECLKLAIALSDHPEKAAVAKRCAEKIKALS